MDRRLQNAFGDVLRESSANSVWNLVWVSVWRSLYDSLDRHSDSVGDYVV